MESLKKFELTPEQLRRRCDPKLFQFECTKDLAPLREFIGQERAIRAVEFGLNMVNDGYNLFVTGLSGTGKTSIVKTYIEKLIGERERNGQRFELEDLCYLYNFKEPDRPQIVSLQQGQGKAFKGQMADLLTSVKDELARVFSSEDYKNQRKKVVEESQSKQQKLFEQVAGEARQQRFFLQITQVGPALIPLVGDRPMEEKEYLALPESQRKKLEAKRLGLLQKLQTSLEKAGSVQQELLGQMRKLDKDIGEFTVSRLFAPLNERYSASPKLKQYLVDLKNYTLENLIAFKVSEEQVNPILGVPMSQLMMGGRDPFLPFQVNLFIDNSEAKGPPVVVEPNPNFSNVFGKVERKFLFGGYLSDHTMIKPGALSQANGGYLLLNVVDVVANPGVWQAFKRAIKNKEVRIEEPFEQFGLIAPQGLRPEPMPIKVKIALIGDPMVYQLLTAYDEELGEIFKVKADFDWQIGRTEENMMSYAAFLSGCCEQCKARHFEPGGVAKVIEYASRAVADQERLSTRFSQLKELIEEANYWANQEKSQYIGAGHVMKAIDERLFRHNLIEERIRDMIDRGMIMIDTGGSVVGQVNGLSVISLGDVMFGRPSRITAKTFLGRSGVINIERESQLSGSIHDKGVMILTGYLGWKYAQDWPLSLSASLCFEQSYEGVEGDSASSTELYAILSSLSGIPIKQGLAVTGSVSQQGEIQPIGGVNQKIEGYFKVCQARGLTGDQGVMIPHQNIKNLMLREEVVDAVKQGKFHIYSARTIDEGIQMLTGMPAGQQSEDGSYPEGTVNYLVSQKLAGMAEKLKSFAAPEEKKTNGFRREPVPAGKSGQKRAS